MTYSLILSSTGAGIGSHAYAETPPFYPSNEQPCTAAQAANPAAWQWNGTALVPATPTLTQQAASALSSGCQIASTASPSLDGTYACDDLAQGRINRVYSLIQRSGGNAFPAGIAELPWPDTNGKLHTFSTVAEFLAFETAIGNYVLALDLIISTGSGTMPPQPVMIP